MLAIVPVNAPASAKRRLEGILSTAERAALVATMLEDVVAACSAASAIERTVVLTPDPALVPAGAEVELDDGSGHATALRRALSARGERPVVVVMADCPLVTGEALDALCAAARPVALAPAQDGGTNALALSHAGAVEPAFGVPGGAAVTAGRARELGLAVEIVHDRGFALDVDTPDDLEQVLEHGPGTRTWALLDRVLRVSAECDGPGR